jgi:hypothetical protein
LDKIAPDGSPISLNANETQEVEAALGLAATVPVFKPVMTSVPSNPTKPAKPSQPSEIVPLSLEDETIKLPGPKKFTLDPIEREQKPQPRKLEPEKETKSIRLPLAIAGIVSLFLIVGAVLLFIESKPRETARNDPDVVVRSEQNGQPKITERSRPKNDRPIPVEPKELESTLLCG